MPNQNKTHHHVYHVLFKIQGSRVISRPGPILMWRLITVILPPSPDSKKVVVSYKRQYVQEVLVNRLVKLTQEKVVR